MTQPSLVTSPRGGWKGVNMNRYDKPETVIVEIQQRGKLMQVSNIDSDVFDPEIGPGDGEARSREFEWEDF